MCDREATTIKRLCPHWGAIAPKTNKQRNNKNNKIITEVSYKI
jgi:hypothetical protein